MVNQKRPLEVTVAIALIFASLIIGLLTLTVSYPRTLTSVKVIIPLIAIGITIILSIMIFHGHNWARMLFIVLCLLWIPFVSSSGFIFQLKVGVLNIFEFVQQIVQILLYIIIVFLLLKRSSADYCKAKSKINPNLFTLLFWFGIFALLLKGFMKAVQFEAPIITTELLFYLGSEFYYGMPLLYDVPLLGVLNFRISSFGIPAIIYAQIYFLISLYRCWSILQGSTARTTPGKAIGFLFIPLFSLYWIFVAIRGLAKDVNAYLESKNVNENKISIGLSTATCIVSIFPFVSLITPILQNILIYKWAKFFNYSVTTLGIKYK